jgi:tetratricopeptide (TPR) repeat protein
MTDDRVRAEEEFTEAIAMPTGMARHEALERAARAADAAGHDLLAATCRIALIDSCYWLNRYDLILAPIAWCRAAEQRDASVFSESEMHSLNWAYKWVPVGLRRDPRFSLPQVNAVLDDLEARYRRLGHSLQPVHGQRMQTAAHLGDFDLADEHFARFMATERDDMSDCAGCVVEEQVEHLVTRGRYEEALRHAEPALAGTFTCSTQPQGVLTALLPALTALGEVERARDAHLTAYRRSQDQAGKGYVGLHLEFCATTGNVPRGMDLLRRHLDQVNHATSPVGTMNFAASAVLLLSRLDNADQVELDVPGSGVLTAHELREQLRTSALTLAAKFDERNGTGWQTHRVRSIMDAPDTGPVPLAVPNPMPAPDLPPVTADPVELADQVFKAIDQNDGFTEHRLLRSLPADLDPLLPDTVAARLAARRVVVRAGARPSTTDLDSLAAAVRRLAEVGEHDQAARFQARLGVLTAQTGDLDSGIATAYEALANADAHSPPRGRVAVRLVLCELLDLRHEHERAGELLAEATRLAEETDPDRLMPGVLQEAAEHEGRRHNLDEADRIITRLLALPLSSSARLQAMWTRIAIAMFRGDPELSLTLADEVLEFIRPYPGPWTVAVHLHRATMLDDLHRTGDHLAELTEVVAVCRTEGAPADTAWACYLLSSGYLAHNRFVEAAEALEEALRLLGPDNTERLLRVTYRLGAVCAELGEHRDARKHYAVAVDLAAGTPAASQAMAWAGLGNTNYELDDLVEAERCHRRAAELWEEAGLPVEAVRAWVKTAGVLADTDPQAAFAATANAMTQIPPDEGELSNRLTAEVLELRAYAHTQAGRHAEALADNLRAADLVAGCGEPAWQVFLMVRAARAHIALGAADKAEDLARDAVELLAEDTPPSIVARVLDVLTKALDAQRKPADTTVKALTAWLRD